MLLLGIQLFGARLFEIFISVIVAIISVCFLIESALSPISWVHAHCPSNWCDMFTNHTVANAVASSVSDMFAASNGAHCPKDYWYALSASSIFFPAPSSFPFPSSLFSPIPSLHSFFLLLFWRSLCQLLTFVICLQRRLLLWFYSASRWQQYLQRNQSVGCCGHAT